MARRVWQYDGRLKERASELRRNMTPQERKLWFRFLRGYPVKVYRQRMIECFIVDFYCARARLAIELDGSQHYSEQGQEYDKERTALIQRNQIEVIRFSNREVDLQFEAVCEKIHQTIQRRVCFFE